MHRILALILISTLSLSACSNLHLNNQDAPKQYIGMFSGALVGGLIATTNKQKTGGRIGITVVGAVIGALIGGGIGMMLDDRDHLQALNSPPKPLPPVKREAIVWHTTQTTYQTPVVKPQPPSAKALSFWNKLPSTQWFVNDSQPMEAG